MIAGACLHSLSRTYNISFWTVKSHEYQPAVFMLSLTHENKYYQVSTSALHRHYLVQFYFQIFLAHAIGLGFSCGLAFIPCTTLVLQSHTLTTHISPTGLAVVSHYFQRQRPFAMGVVAAGSALGLYFARDIDTQLILASQLGAVLHPIMLNHLFQGPLGFHNGVRVSAALNTFLLIIANLLMRTRLPPKKVGSALPIAEFARDPPYLFFVIA